MSGWLAADEIAQRTIAERLAASTGLTEPGVARTIAVHLPAGAVLTVASSMPIRDLEWFGGHRAGAHANRGANGIDGVVSTALGRALSGSTSVVLIGDLAFVHDCNALVGLMARGTDLRVVVVDNDGGGIFSFLPQATSLASDRFEQLFGTPLGADVLAIAAAHGIPMATATTETELVDQLGAARAVGLPGPVRSTAQRRDPRRAPRGRDRRARPLTAGKPVSDPQLTAVQEWARRQGRTMALSIAWNLAWVSASSAERFAVGDDAAAGDETSGAAIVGQFRAPDRDGPRAVAERVDPTDGAAVAAPLEALDALDQLDRRRSRMSTERRRRAQRAHELDHRRGRAATASLPCGFRGAGRWRP